MERTKLTALFTAILLAAVSVPLTASAEEALPRLELIFGIKQMPDKTVYGLGETLDLTGGIVYDYATYIDYDADGRELRTYLDRFDQPMTREGYVLDASAFDNTTPGTYRIDLTKTETIEGTTASKTVSFEVMVGTRGDVSGDGQIDAVDASNLLIECTCYGATGYHQFDARQLVFADYNEDGSVDAADASDILIQSTKDGVAKG